MGPAAARRTGRSRDQGRGRSPGQGPAGRFRSPVPGRTARDEHCERDARVQRAAPRHLAAKARGAEWHRARGTRDAAAGLDAVAGFRGAGFRGTGPRGTGPRGAGPRGAGPRGAGPRGTGPRGTGRRDMAGPRGTGSRGGRPGFRGARTLRAAGTLRPVSPAREVAAWAAGPAGQPGQAVPSRGPRPGPGALRPDSRAAVAPPPYGPGPPAAVTRSARREACRPPSAP